MLISWTLPTHNRTPDLLATLPHVIAAANTSPPVEIVIIDYASHPLVEPQIEDIRHQLSDVNRLVLRLYLGRTHYHMAHARNLGIRAAAGDWIVISSADIRPSPSYFTMLRARIAETGATWLTPHRLYRGVVACQRGELLAAGGFDERMEFYGPEDAELEARLRRRGTPWAPYPDGHLSVIPTPNWQKVQGYRQRLSKSAMHKAGRAVLEENEARGLLVANDGQAWGEW